MNTYPDLQTSLNSNGSTAWRQTFDSTGPPPPAPQQHLAALQIVNGRLAADWTPVARTGTNPATGKSWAWPNLYMYLDMGDVPGSSFYFEKGVILDSDSLKNCNAAEGELQKITSNWLYNGGFQFRLQETKPAIRVYNYSATPRAWVDTPFTVDPGDFMPGVETRIGIKYHFAARQVLFEALWVNGRKMDLGIVFPAVSHVAPDYLHCAVQLDSLNQNNRRMQASYRATVVAE